MSREIDFDYCLQCEHFHRVPADMIDPSYDECFALKGEPDPSDEDCPYCDDYRATHPDDYEDEEESA